jgi:hypothetical protein
MKFDEWLAELFNLADIDNINRETLKEYDLNSFYRAKIDPIEIVRMFKMDHDDELPSIDSYFHDDYIEDMNTPFRPKKKR